MGFHLAATVPCGPEFRLALPVLDDPELEQVNCELTSRA